MIVIKKGCDTMHEKHNVEYKSLWKDEYLKWISGFANASRVVPFLIKQGLLMSK